MHRELERIARRSSRLVITNNQTVWGIEDKVDEIFHGNTAHLDLELLLDSRIAVRG